MNAQELREAVKKIIDETQQKVLDADEGGARSFIDVIPDHIKTAILRRERSIRTYAFNATESEKLKRAGCPQRAPKGESTNPEWDKATLRDCMLWVALLIFTRCQETEILKPAITPDPLHPGNMVLSISW